MVIQLKALQETMSAGSMDITETFRTDDITKTDFFDFVTAPDTIGIGINDRVTSDTNGNNLDAPLQGFDQFWGAEKDVNRFESTIFEDLNRYCWTQQNNSGELGSQVCNTDGQIYTLTVLNGNEPWLLSQQQEPIMVQRKVCDTAEETPAPALDFDSLLNTFPGYIKTEYSYDDSGFSTDNKDDILIHSSSSSVSNASSISNVQQQQQQQQQQQPPQQPPQQQQQQQQQTHQSALQQNQHNQQQQIPVTNSTNLNSTLNAAFHNNNNNDWQMADHNIIVEDGNETPESLLRSALQGKGYSKGMQQNTLTVIPSINSIKTDATLRRAIFSNDAQTTLTFADSTLNNPLFDENHSGVQSTNSSLPTSNQSDGTENGVMVDDMFLTLDSSFTDDFEKIKRIASDVQQFCITDDFSEMITEVAIPSNAASIVSTTAMSQQDIVTTSNSALINSRPSTTTAKQNKATKKYKRSPNHNNNNINVNNNNLTNSNGNMNLNTAINGQRKERSLHYCSICSKGFKDKYSVNVHHRTHTGEKPFSCSLCGKSFRQKAHLAKHYQTHLAQKSAITTKGSKAQQQQQQHQQPHPAQTTVPTAVLTNGTNIIR